MVSFIENAQPKRKPPVPLIDTERKIILFWMHRCGSTSAQLWFFHMVGWGNRIPGKGASGLSAEWHEAHEDIYQDHRRFYEDPSFLKIVAVRDPFSRVVSAFSVVTDTISGSQWRAVSKSIVDPDADRRLSFLEFLDFLSITDLATANYHWRLQTAQDCFTLNIAGTQVVRLETMQSDLNRMSALLGVRPISIGRSSATTKLEHKAPPSDLLNMTRKDLAKYFGRDRRGVIRFPDYSCFLTEETRRRISGLYAADFAGLGYPVAG